MKTMEGTRAVVLIALGLAGGCSKADVKCGEGTVLKDGACVVASPTGTTLTSVPPASPPPAATTAAKPAEPPSDKSSGTPELPAPCAEFKNLVDHHCDAQALETRLQIDGVLAQGQKGLANLPEAQRPAELEGWSKNCRKFIEDWTPKCSGDASAAPTVDTAKLKDTVKFDHSEWVVLSATWKGRHLASNNQFQKALTVDEGKLAMVQFKVRNNLNEKTTVSQPKVRDSKGRVFEAHEDSTYYIPADKVTAGLMEDVAPTISKEFWEVYQVADDSTDLVLLTHDVGGDMFHDDPNVKPVALGLK